MIHLRAHIPLNFRKVSGFLGIQRNAVKTHDLLSLLNFHIFAIYNVWMIFNGKKTQNLTIWKYYEKKLELRFSALSPPQRTVYCTSRGSTVEVSRLNMKDWKSRLCRDLQLVVQ